MSENANIKTFYIGTLITSVVGGILLLFTDFAGWDGSNAYLGIYSWGYIGSNLDNPLSIIPFLILACMLFYCAYVSYLGFSKEVPKELINRSFLFSAIVFAIVVFGALFFIISISTEDVWWWMDAGFYGGFIGSGLSTLFLYQIKKSI